jgi:membrane-bound serine protease (ClpP class)
VGQGEVRLDTQGMVTTVSSPSWRSRLLSFLADPQVAYILLTVGTYGIIAEMWMPGTVLPGLTGVICLLLAFYAFQMLPVDGTGLSLLLLGLVLMAAEVFVAGFGALGVAGIVAFVVGSIMLFDTGVPGYGIPWPLVAVVAGSFALLLTAAIILVIRNRRRVVAEGGERLLREPAEVLDWHGGQGWVRVQGERWVATGPADLRVGEIVGVKGRNGLQLSIERQDSAQ